MAEQFKQLVQLRNFMETQYVLSEKDVAEFDVETYGKSFNLIVKNLV